LDVKHLRRIKAESGERGRGKDQYGKGGRAYEIRVPLGTSVFEESGSLLLEIVETGQREVVARGGRGGRGNIHFASPVERAPRRAEPGGKGESKTLRLELKVMADVGLLGFPNVGKSSLIRAISKATPKVADYPFTTLTPHLGVVPLGEPKNGLGRSFVVADVPGLIRGASSGAGLGTTFLRHLDRTRVLLHLLSWDPAPDRSPLDDYHALREELERHSPDLATRPELVAMNKSDLPEARQAFEHARVDFQALDKKLYLVSALAGDGLAEVVYALGGALGLSKPETI
jgi:GTP-binding protein